LNIFAKSTQIQSELLIFNNSHIIFPFANACFLFTLLANAEFDSSLFEDSGIKINTSPFL